MDPKFRPMYEWASTLSNSAVDESSSFHTVMAHGHGHGHEVEGKSCSVRGFLQGWELRATYDDFYPYGIRRGETKLSVLDVFVADPSVSFDGQIRRSGLIDGMKRVIGMSPGVRLCEHPLLRQHVVEVEASQREPMELADPRMCDLLSSFLSGTGAWRPLAESGRGLRALFVVSIYTTTIETYASRAQWVLNLCAQRRQLLGARP